MKRCPTCHVEYSNDANFCPVDAALLGEAIEEDAEASAKAADSSGVERLGHFVLGTRIGGNRTGDVYFATDEQSDASCVAKIVHTNVFDKPAAKKRAARELRQLAKVEHPAVARILGHGKRDGQLWVAMESCAGKSLEVAIQEEGAFAPDRAARIVSAIGSALAEAAKLGVIHRDLAPKNVLLTAEDEVKLINFALPLPATDQVAGVPEFVAPEQVDGRPLDQRSSIYSLGALYYLMLTGRAPHVGTPSEVLKAHKEASPLAPSKVLDTVPLNLDQVVLTALESDAGDRHLTLRQFVTRVDELNVSSDTQPIGRRSGSQTLVDDVVDESPTIPLEEKTSGTSGKKDAMARTMIGYGAIRLGDLGAAQTIAEASGESTPAGPDEGPVAASVEESDDPPTELDASPGNKHRTQVSGPSAPVSEPPPSAAADLAPPLGTNPGVPLVAAAPAFSPAPEPSEEPVVPAVLMEKSGGAQPEEMSTGAVPAPASGKGGKKQKRTPERNKGNKFRETLWFKKGELDEAAAKKAAEAAKKGKPDAVIDKADSMPIEERYADDGTLSDDDRKRLSLRTGKTLMMEKSAIEDARNARRGEVSERELLREMQGNRNKMIGIAAAILVVLAFAIGLLL